ncbi:hypothetical protein ARTHRO8AJ_90023 [Arthrobacter sp. 8AJ]|nr:hypothetical protein ARTHRO8AJ_90023 [Arthrobacter sp. 8AJ]
MNLDRLDAVERTAINAMPKENAAATTSGIRPMATKPARTDARSVVPIKAQEEAPGRIIYASPFLLNARITNTELPWPRPLILACTRPKPPVTDGREWGVSGSLSDIPSMFLHIPICN